MLLKAAMFYGKEDLRVEEVEKPTVAGNEALVRVRAAGICGTDLHIYKGGFAIKKLPLIIGHEYSGIVEQVGSSISGIKPRDKVIGSYLIPCGKCRFCIDGRFQLCDRRVALGTDIDGAFAEWVRIPEADNSLANMPEGISFEEAALAGDLVLTSLHGVERAGVKEGDTVAIFGLGPIGLVALMIAKARGARYVIGVDLVEDLLELGKRLGAEETVNAARQDPPSRIRRLTEGLGVDIALDAVGLEKTLDQALASLRKGGRLSLLGLPERPPAFNIKKVIENEIDVVGAFCPAGKTAIQGAAELVRSRRIHLESLITHRLSLVDINRGFEIAMKKLEGAVKVVVVP